MSQLEEEKFDQSWPVPADFRFPRFRSLARPLVAPVPADHLLYTLGATNSFMSSSQLVKP